MKFENIYKTYWQKVFRLCMGYVNNTDTAKDLTQDTFIKIFQQLPKFRNESSIGTWIFRIASNTCLRQIQKDNKMPKSEFPINMTAEALDISIEDDLKFLYQCISELKEVERIIIALELEDINQKEIAKIVGISESNVRVKNKRKIKTKIQEKWKII
jgi:RNA polymerase sigma-70 factor (ECF subfamily)